MRLYIIFITIFITNILGIYICDCNYRVIPNILEANLSEHFFTYNDNSCFNKNYYLDNEIYNNNISSVLFI